MTHDISLQELRRPDASQLAAAPELAALFLLDAALDTIVQALFAQHPTLIDDLRCPREDGRVVEAALRICRRAMALRDDVRRYHHAALDAISSNRADDDIPF